MEKKATVVSSKWVVVKNLRIVRMSSLLLIQCPIISTASSMTKTMIKKRNILSNFSNPTLKKDTPASRKKRPNLPKRSCLKSGILIWRVNRSKGIPRRGLSRRGRRLPASMIIRSWTPTRPPNSSWRLYPCLTRRSKNWRVWRRPDLLGRVKRILRRNHRLVRHCRSRRIKVGKEVIMVVQASPPPPKNCMNMKARETSALLNQWHSKMKIVRLNKIWKCRRMLLQIRQLRKRSRIMKMIRNELEIWLYSLTVILQSSLMDFKFDNFGNDFRKYLSSFN